MELHRAPTIDDLYHVEDKAELVNGEIVVMPAGGGLHGFAEMEVLVSLHAYVGRTGRGYAIGDSVGFVVNLPNRRSFCPDGAYWTGAAATPWSSSRIVRRSSKKDEMELHDCQSPRCCLSVSSV